MENLKRYFTELTAQQIDRFQTFEKEMRKWNERINLVSRKDILHFELHHLIHSVSISKVLDFPRNTSVIDLGTGGGLPGIPLAILYPDSRFYLVESIRKKIDVVGELIDILQLKNAIPIHSRIEDMEKEVDYVVSRWVGPTKEIIKRIHKEGSITFTNQPKSGLWLWKGGDLTEELSGIEGTETHALNKFFEQPFYATKKIIHIPKESIATFAHRIEKDR